MHFLYIKENKLLKKLYKIWDKVSNSVNNRLDNEPLYNKEYLKPKTKFYQGKFFSDFYFDKILRKGSHCMRVLLTVIDTVFKMRKDHYPSVYVEK